MERTAAAESMRPSRSFSAATLSILWALFIGALVPVWLGSWNPRLAPSQWTDAALAWFALAVTVAALSRQLPLQNVLGAAFVLYCVERATLGSGRLAGLDLQTNATSTRFFPWAYAAADVAVVLSARGTARLILRQFRLTHNYFFYFIGLAIVLVALFTLGFEPFATQVREYYFWPTTRAAVAWFAVPWYGFLGRAAVSGLGLVLATPFLISKRPIPVKDSLQPFAVWLLLNLLCVSGVIAHQLWPAAWLILGANLLLPTLAILAAHRRPPVHSS